MNNKYGDRRTAFKDRIAEDAENRKNLNVLMAKED